MSITLLGALVAAGLAGAVVTRLAELAARRRELLDVPSERSSHVIATPRLGGVGIMAGTLAGVLVAGGPDLDATSLLLAIALALGVVGVLDDLGRSSVAGKYLAQLVAAIAIVVVLQPSVHLALLGLDVTLDGWFAFVLTAIGITAVINAWNFMDGIDGMMGSVTVAVGLVALALVTPDAALLAVAIIGATAGFLVWNHHPASIFMGDGGSQFLGAVVIAVLLLGGDADVGVVPAVGATAEVVPLGLVLAPLLFDTGLTLLRRARGRRDLFAAHREHLYQRLNATGVGVRTIVAGYVGATLVLGVVAVAWPALPSWAQGAALVGAVAVGIAYVAAVDRAERGVARDGESDRA